MPPLLLHAPCCMLPRRDASPRGVDPAPRLRRPQSRRGELGFQRAANVAARAARRRLVAQDGGLRRASTGAATSSRPRAGSTRCRRCATASRRTRSRRRPSSRLGGLSVGRLKQASHVQVAPSSAASWRRPTPSHRARGSCSTRWVSARRMRATAARRRREDHGAEFTPLIADGLAARLHRRAARSAGGRIRPRRSARAGPDAVQRARGPRTGRVIRPGRDRPTYAAPKRVMRRGARRPSSIQRTRAARGPGSRGAGSASARAVATAECARAQRR